MSKKIVIEEKGANVIIGVQETGQDPYVMATPGTLENVLPAVQAIIAQAALVRAQTPRQPYTNAKPVVKAGDAVVKKTRKLEKKEEQPAVVPTEATEPVAEAEELTAETGEEAEVTPTEAVQEALPEIKASEPEIKAPEAEIKTATFTVVDSEPETESPATDGSIAVATPKKRRGAAEEFFLVSDPGTTYPDIQSVFDAMGMDKEKRPHHNRYDRLSSDLKAKIGQKGAAA